MITRNIIQQSVYNCKLRLVNDQHPPYSPDLAPSGFHLFGSLNYYLGGKHFSDDDDFQHEVLLWIKRQPMQLELDAD